jgi:hypothetical protein
MMDPVLREFGAEVAKMKLNPPTTPYLSGRWITPEEATDPQYWVAHLRQPVQLARGFEELLLELAQMLLEVDPHTTMSDAGMRQLSFSAQTTVISSLPGARESDSKGEAMLKALGRLWLAGQEIDWDGSTSIIREAGSIACVSLGKGTLLDRASGSGDRIQSFRQAPGVSRSISASSVKGLSSRNVKPFQAAGPPSVVNPDSADLRSQ